MTGKNGGQPLKELLVTGAEADTLREKAAGLRALRLSARSLSDVELLAIGGYSPLDGFMTRADYLGAVNDMHLSDGTAWAMPITLAVSEDEASSVREGEEVALADESGHAMALLEIREKFPYDKGLEARNVFRTEEEAHPGVAALYAQGPVLLGGPVRAFEIPPQSPLLGTSNSNPETSHESLPPISLRVAPFPKENRHESSFQSSHWSARCRLNRPLGRQRPSCLELRLRIAAPRVVCFQSDWTAVGDILGRH